MGCFDATCMISNLPIKHGDEIVMLVLLGSPHGDRVEILYPNEAWGPILMPLFGEYDDYGGIELTPDQKAVGLLVQYLNENRAKAEDEELLTEDDLLRRELSDVLFKHPYGKPEPLTVTRTFMHRRLWDHMTQEMTDTVWDRSVHKSVVLKLSDMILSNFQKLKAAHTERMRLYAGLQFTESTAKVMCDSSELRRFLNSDNGGHNWGGEFLLERADDLIEEFAIPTLTLCHAMYLLRRSFLPLQTIGEQHGDLKGARDFLDVCRAVADEKIAKRYEDDDDDE